MFVGAPRVRCARKKLQCTVQLTTWTFFPHRYNHVRTYDECGRAFVTLIRGITARSVFMSTEAHRCINGTLAQFISIHVQLLGETPQFGFLEARRVRIRLIRAGWALQSSRSIRIVPIDKVPSLRRFSFDGRAQTSTKSLQDLPSTFRYLRVRN